MKAQLAPFPRPAAEEDPAARVRGNGATQARVLRVRRLRRWQRRAALGVAAVVLLAAGIVVGWRLTEGAQVAVPDVTGRSVSVANTTLQDAGFATALAPTPGSGDVVPNAVLTTSPAPGAVVARGQVVTITFASGTSDAVVPALAALPEAEARDLLADADLVVIDRVAELSADVPAGDVIRSEPPGGATLASGAGVTLVVSAGAPPVILPRVIGFTEAGAAQELRALGFTVQVLRVSSPVVPADRVLSQTPEAGLPVRSGDTVTLTVSTGA